MRTCLSVLNWDLGFGVIGLRPTRPYTLNFQNPGATPNRDSLDRWGARKHWEVIELRELTCIISKLGSIKRVI